MPPIVRKTPQHTVASTNNLWNALRRVAATQHEDAANLTRRAWLAYIDKYGTAEDKRLARTPDEEG